MIYGFKKKELKMDIKSEVIEIIDELFMEDVSDMMDEDLFWCRCLGQHGERLNWL